jgi:hypothetical protein
LSIHSAISGSTTLARLACVNSSRVCATAAPVAITAKATGKAKRRKLVTQSEFMKNACVGNEE